MISLKYVKCKAKLDNESLRSKYVFVGEIQSLRRQIGKRIYQTEEEEEEEEEKKK